MLTLDEIKKIAELGSKIMITNKPYDKGSEAFRQGKNLYDNPYREDWEKGVDYLESEEYKFYSWRAGYMQAQRSHAMFNTWIR